MLTRAKAKINGRNKESIGETAVQEANIGSSSESICESLYISMVNDTEEESSKSVLEVTVTCD